MLENRVIMYQIKTFVGGFQDGSDGRLEKGKNG
jgi:hypothetical protein